MIPGFRPRKKKQREGPIQQAVVTYAKEKYTKKQILPVKRQAGKFGTNGWPDYEFLIARGYSFHMEFKAPGENCTDLQLQRHAELRALGHHVYVVDNVLVGRQVIDAEVAGRRTKRVAA